MEKLEFIITTSKELDFDWDLKTHQKYPTHEQHLKEEHKLKIIYEFIPTKGFDITIFVEFMIKYLQRKYRTMNVVVL